MVERFWLNVITEHDPQELGTQIMADQELMRTIDQLPPQRKAVFSLCKLEGKSYKEVSSMFSISEAAVNDHITKANKFFLKNYNKSLPVFFSIIIYNAQK
ncbi:hypothetical protein H3Z85_17945 [Chryseobacterium indologenes]|uniref:sigma factor-like helix-turn-helix DNA-binding protein n=1 Tax=Chryseobacterium indologenes TaxID=253 RepID=UPI0003E06C26|nr:sigma factor-like helix-turn-helix DNA-binding protein [Chryseobacterium indologenes]QPQ51192.1 hypothetical protein H3Z85_17945 [Chryseobacterium indologenes]GAE66770.1 hypothetical protein CIN01S_18_00970 [Chryseobacterium indologenes NBRC 14944]